MVHIIYSTSIVTKKESIWGFYTTEEIAEFHMEKAITKWGHIYKFEYKRAKLVDTK